MIRVLVAEDMRILRDTLVAVLNLEDDIDVVAELADGDAIVPAALADRPDVAVVGIALPGADGLTAAAGPARAVPQVPGADPDAARNYLASAVTKLSARNRVDAVRIAAEAVPPAAVPAAPPSGPVHRGPRLPRGPWRRPTATVRG